MNQLLTLLLPWPWRAFNPITDTFVYGIFLSFIICSGVFLWKTTLRARLIKILGDQVNKHAHPVKPEILTDLKMVFDSNNELSEVWQEFQNSLITRQPKENQEKIVYKTDEASFFFSEERLLGQYMNLRFWNSVPALLVGLGILGTFVGLVGGLIPFSGISFEETGEIRSAIEGLLSGVSTAFVTSVWGMLLSLLFNWMEKSCIGWVSRKIAMLQRGLDQLFTLTTQEEIAFRQEDELAQQTQALKAFSTDLANEIKSAMAQGRQEIIAEFRNAPETFSNAIGEQLTPSLNHLNSAVTDSTTTLKSTMEDGNQQILQLLSNTHQVLSTMIEKQLASNLDNLNSVVSEIKQTIVEGNQEVLRELRNAPDAFGEVLVAKFSPIFNNLNSAVEALQRHKEESSADAIQQLVVEFQQSLSGSATAQMEALAETVNKASQSLITLPEQLAGMMLGVQEQVNQTRQLLSETSQNQTEQVKIMMESVSNTFQNAIDTHEAGLTATTDSMSQEMKQIANQIRDLLESAAKSADEQLAQRITDIEQTSAQTAQTLQTLIAELQKSMTSITAQTTEKSEAVIKGMHELIDQSVDGLKTLLRRETAQIVVINGQVDKFQKTVEKSTEMLEKMDENVANFRELIQTTKSLSVRLAAGTGELKLAGQKLTEASDSFNQENAKYLTATRETIEMIEETLEESQDLLNKFTQRFQTIDSGLTNIFKEIEGGLTNYSTTTRESINTYLGDFSKHLTEASAALAGGVEALTENVHELTDMIEKQPTQRRL